MSHAGRQRACSTRAASVSRSACSAPGSRSACLADAKLTDAVALMREHHVGCVLAVENDRLVGILTERDPLLKLETADFSRPVRELMTPHPEVLQLDDPIVYALHRMAVGG